MRILFIIFLLLYKTSNAQFKAKEINKIPTNYKLIYETKEKEIGFLMSFKEFKKGNFIEASTEEKKSFMTTMLLGSATNIFTYLKNNYNDFIPSVFESNGFTSTVFKVEYTFQNGKIFIVRKLLYGNLLFDPLCAEKPESYGMLIGFEINDNSEKEKIISELIKYWSERNIQYKLIKDNELK